MLIDTIHGIIDRRVLLNYSIEPTILRRVLPPPFQPKLYKGRGVGGVCMIRFKHLRPRFVPSWMGLGSENAAHRIAVTWTQDGEVREGVFIPRRDTNSFISTVVGGRVFPGNFNRSQFKTRESDAGISVQIASADKSIQIAFVGELSNQLPSTSIFPSLEAAEEFFSSGATGYSATHKAGHYHGMELWSKDWTIKPLTVKLAESCFFDDKKLFPPGSINLDCALLMRGIEHEWHGRPDLYLSSSGTFLSTHKVKVT